MFIRLLTASLFVAVMALLIIQRFSLPPELPVRIAAGSGEDAGYGFREGLRRGSVVQTGNGYVKVTVGVELEDVDQAQTILWLGPNTTIELHRLFENELTIQLTRGRIVVQHQGNVPLTIETNFTSHKVLDDVVSFVNYDFLETIDVIPLSGSVEVYVEATGESLLTPTPISIHETDPVTIKTIETNLATSDAADFYRWVGVLQD